MEKLKIKVFAAKGVKLPEYKTLLAAGMDVRTRGCVNLQPHERQLMKTGIFVAIPEGYEIQVRPRSGLVLTKGLTVANSPGTIDADYRGEISIILQNNTNKQVIVEVDERIAQLVLKRVETIEWDEVGTVEELGGTERGSGGFGHTGKK